PGLEEQAFYDPVNFTFPSGAHVAEVEIDPDTGAVALVNYVAVDDVGTVINPMIVQGQIHGGLVQGIGQALCESCVYDEVSGQLLSGSFMDYCMPRTGDIPSNACRDIEHDVHSQSSWGERLRRTRHDRCAGYRHQRRCRCALASGGDPRRHAGLAEPHMADHRQRWRR